MMARHLLRPDQRGHLHIQRRIEVEQQDLGLLAESRNVPRDVAYRAHAACAAINREQDLHRNASVSGGGVRLGLKLQVDAGAHLTQVTVHRLSKGISAARTSEMRLEESHRLLIQSAFMQSDTRSWGVKLRIGSNKSNECLCILCQMMEHI